MHSNALSELADRVERSSGAGAELVTEVAEALATAFPAAARTAEPALLDSTDAALQVVDAAVPAWEVTLKGVALQSGGRWHCTLRRASVTDDDAVIGFGEAPCLARALIAALLRIAVIRIGH